MLYRYSIFLAGLVLASTSVRGQVPASERIPVTDPDRLQKMGFDRHARNVFEWSRADRTTNESKSFDPSELPKTWGTSLGFSTIYGHQLQAVSSVIKVFRGNDAGAYCYDSTAYPDGVRAFAQIQAPEGASLGEFRSWSYDLDPSKDLTFRVWETCQEYGYDSPTHTLVAENSTLGAIGYLPGTKSLQGLTVDNDNCAYTVDVQFAGPDESCSYGALRVLKLQTTWTRQVSPAPATATFGDVPTDHRFFQFVEALVKSGITAGCGGDNYCPDAPITRGQMAVFLAKALGLQWP